MSDVEEVATPQDLLRMSAKRAPFDLRAVEAARKQHGHNDTCELRLIQSELRPVCNCGYDGANKALAALRDALVALKKARPFIIRERRPTVLAAVDAVLAKVRDE